MTSVQAYIQILKALEEVSDAGRIRCDMSVTVRRLEALKKWLESKDND